MDIKGNFGGGKPMIDIYLEGCDEPINVLVDTGFNGELMLTKKKIEELSLTSIGDDEYMTASGDIIPTTVHMGSIKWFGRTRKIAVLATSGKSNLMTRQKVQKGKKNRRDTELLQLIDCISVAF